MSLDNQRNLKLALWPRADVFMAAADEVAGEMNVWARGFLHRPIVQDWRAQLDFTTRIFRPRGLHLDDRHVQLRGRRVPVRLDRRRRALRLQQPPRPPGMKAAASSSICPKSRPLKRRRCWNDDSRRSRAPFLSLPRGEIKVYVLVEQIEALVPASGGFVRRSQPPLRRLQHRTLGLHQQRLRCGVMGSGGRESEHRCDHDDLRLHASLRSHHVHPRGQYTRSKRPFRSLAGRDGAEHSRSDRRPASRASMARAIAGAGASGAKAPAASGSRTGRWCTSSGPCGNAWAHGENQLGHTFPPRTYEARTRTGCCCSSRRPNHSGRHAI